MSGTKRVDEKKSRNWCFTYFYYLDEDIDYILDKIPSKGTIFQEEMCPTTQQPHLQGFIRFFKAYTMKKVKKMFGENRQHVHLEQARSPADAVAYCRKGETRFGEMYEQGDLEFKQGERTDLSAIRVGFEQGMTYDTLVREHFSNFVRYHSGLSKAKFFFDKARAFEYRQVEVIVITGVSNIRKTGITMSLFKPFRLTQEKQGSMWFDGYDGEDTLLLDDFHGGWMPHAMLLGLLEGHSTRLATKGGSTWAAWTRVVITSNWDPHAWYPTYSPAGCRIELARRVTRWYAPTLPVHAADLYPALTGVGPLYFQFSPFRTLQGVDYDAAKLDRVM